MLTCLPGLTIPQEQQHAKLIHCNVLYYCFPLSVLPTLTLLQNATPQQGHETCDPPPQESLPSDPQEPQSPHSPHCNRLLLPALMKRKASPGTSLPGSLKSLPSSNTLSSTFPNLPTAQMGHRLGLPNFYSETSKIPS